MVCKRGFASSRATASSDHHEHVRTQTGKKYFTMEVRHKCQDLSPDTDSRAYPYILHLCDDLESSDDDYDIEDEDDCR